MIHIGTAEYYQHIQEELEKCDVIFYEGVRSTKGRVISRAYEILAKSPRLNFVTQRQAINYSVLSEKLIWADIEAEKFESEWEKLPLRTKLAVRFVAPMCGFLAYFFMTSSQLAKIIEPRNLPAQEPTYSDGEPDEEMEKLIMTVRDNHLITVVNEFFQENKQKGLKVGVLYGARHLDALGSFLDKQGYHVAEGVRVRVFPIR